MFEIEARWIAREMQKLGLETSPMLNVGSSTLHVRTVVQPFIDRLIVKPFESEGGKFLHLDIKDEEGVDLVGDLMDSSFREQLKTLKPRGVLCANLLEHVSDPQVVCNLLIEIVEPGGYIIITVPHLYPYHRAPIDTMFRPTVEDLEKMMPTCQLICGEIITITGRSLAQSLMRNPRWLGATALRVMLPFYKRESRKHIIEYLPNVFKAFQVTCAIFCRVRKGPAN